MDLVWQLIFLSVPIMDSLGFDFSSDIDPDHNYFNYSEQNLDSQNQCKYFQVHEFRNLIQNSQSQLFIINFNIRSFYANSDAFFCLFEENMFPDIIILTETWFKHDNAWDMNGYLSYHTIRNHARSGGVSIYVKNNLVSNIMPDLCKCDETIEICSVSIQINNFPLNILGIYRPHSGSIDNFNQSLTTILENRLILNKPIIITGDLNINLLNDNLDSRSFINNLQSYHFLSLITKPTRFSQGHHPSLLDHFWTNEISLFSCGIVLTDVTDHCMTFLIHRTKNLNKSTKTKITFRLTNETNKNRFRTLLQNFDWDSIATDDVNIYTDKFIKCIDSLYCDCFPLKIKFLPTKVLEKPWITSDIRKLISYKSQYFHLFKLGVVTENDNKTFKNKVHSIIKKSKNDYYKNIFFQNKHNLKKTWNLINSLMGRNVQNNSIKKLVIDGIDYYDSGGISEIMNAYFSNIASSLDDLLPSNSIDPLQYVKRNESPFVLNPITIYECSTLIKNLKNTKQDINKIPVDLFIEYHTYFVRTITKIINLCYQNGKFPNSLKTACITPIFKAGNPEHPQNYRPISILPFLSKIFERSLCNRICNFTDNYSIISSKQFGFRKNMSTETALCNFTEYLYDSLDSSDVTCNIFIDFKKAFDTVQHSIL